MKVQSLSCLLVFIVVLIVGINRNCVSDTNVSGYISVDTTWTSANSPYIVTGSILVKSGVTLTIEPGVTIKFNSGKSIQAEGTLIAKGSNSEKITFTTNYAGDYWGYILFADSSVDTTFDDAGNYTGGSILEYCVVEYAGGTDEIDNGNGAIRMDSAHIYINNCTIKNNATSGILAYNLSGTIKITNNTISDNIVWSNSSGRGGGINISSSEDIIVTIIISNNTISNNTAQSPNGDTDGYGGGIFISTREYYDKVTISDNIITNNTVSAGAISYGGGIYINSDIITISSNTISNNSASQGGGIFCYNRNATITITNNTISGNIADTNGGGICFSSYYSYGTNTISNNIISKNSASDGGGIYGYYGTLIISNNIIFNNTTFAASSTSGGGIEVYDSTATISNNIISNNTASSSTSSVGGGISVYSGSPTISANSLTGNTAENAASVYYKSDIDDSEDNSKYFNYNTIVGNKTTTNDACTIYVYPNPLFNYNNIFGNIATYELWNDNKYGSNNLDAKNNWWGSTNSLDIETKIYDWFDDSNKGFVDYDPFDTAIRTDTPISPPANLSVTAGTDQITLKWSANTESDIAGYIVYWDTDSGHSYASSFDVGNVTNYEITGLASGTYYVTVSAYDSTYKSANDSSDTIINENQTNGNESWYAMEKTVSVGVIPTPTPSISPLPTPIPSPSLSKECIVSGYVANQNNNLLEGVTITITSIDFSDSTSSDEDGYYLFSRLIAGEYTLTYEKEGYITKTREISLIEGEEKYLAVTVLIEQMQNGRLSGYVYNMKGYPIESAKIRLKGINSKILRKTISDEDGLFEFTDLDADTYTITAIKKGYKIAKQTITLEAGEEKDIEIVMKRTSKRGR